MSDQNKNSENKGNKGNSGNMPEPVALARGLSIEKFQKETSRDISKNKR